MVSVDGALVQIKPWSLYSGQKIALTGFNSEVCGRSIGPLMEN